ncbi:MAG: rane protein [Paenibacillaceae bacterium]|jgi:uncharacterized membrane protein YesL|nr:rane protein [Paenibacillaceae bacterium]
MEMKGWMGGIYRVCEWIMRFAVANILWVVCSFPIFFLSLLAIVNVQLPEVPRAAVNQLLLLMAVLTPFLLFPATSAMFALARKWVMGEGDVPLVKTFFRSYKENYRQSMAGGIVFFILYAIMYVNYHFYISQSGNIHWLAYLFITLSIIMGAALFNFFSLTVHFHMTFWQILKNSILVSIGHPITSVALLVTNLAILYISIAKITFLIPFFMGSLIAFLSFWHFNRIYSRMQFKQEQAEYAAEEAKEARESKELDVKDEYRTGDSEKNNKNQ